MLLFYSPGTSLIRNMKTFLLRWWKRLRRRYWTCLGLPWAEQVNQARGESILFNADRKAYQQDGKVFLLERWLDHLSKALKDSEFFVIDHRLNGQSAPTIDLRNFGLPTPDDNAAPAGQLNGSSDLNDWD